MRGCVLAALVALSLSACVPEDGGPPRPGEPARPYAATTLEGDTVSLRSLEGKVVLLNLWATWCAPCRAEMPYLQELSEEFAERGLEVVGISQDTGNAAEAISSFLDEADIHYTILHDPAMRGMELYRVLGLPATFLIDREGVLRWMRYGQIPEGDTEFLAALEDLLS